MRFASWCISALALACASSPAPPPAASAAHAAVAAQPVAQPAPVAEAGPAPIFRLPADVHPTAQSVSLEVDPDAENFHGTVEIALVLDTGRQDLFVSARGLRFPGPGTVESGGRSVEVRIETDDARGVARLVPPVPFPAGPARLLLAFEG